MSFLTSLQFGNWMFLVAKHLGSRSYITRSALRQSWIYWTEYLSFYEVFRLSLSMGIVNGTLTSITAPLTLKLCFLLCVSSGSSYPIKTKLGEDDKFLFGYRLLWKCTKENLKSNLDMTQKMSSFQFPEPKCGLLMSSFRSSYLFLKQRVTTKLSSSSKHFVTPASRCSAVIRIMIHKNIQGASPITTFYA